MKRRRTTRAGYFFRENRRLLLFLLLPVAGSVCGMLLYPAVKAASWMELFTVHRVAMRVPHMVSAVLESCFQPALLLAMLFVAGLSACGAPAALLVPVFWGVGLGLTQAGYYTGGVSGVAVAAAVILPHSAMEAVALLMGASECFRMSVRFAVQLLPRSAHCGGLWQEFRLYMARFGLLLLLLICAGVLDVGMRLCCSGWLN